MLVHHRVEGISLDIVISLGNHVLVQVGDTQFYSRSFKVTLKGNQGSARDLKKKNTNWAGVRSLGNSLRRVSFSMLPTLAAV